MNPKLKTIITQLIICLLPLVYLFSVWNELPEVVPMHYNSSGPDRFGSKTELVFVLIFMVAMAFGTSLLVRNAHLIDPKYKDRMPGSAMIKISWAILIFISAISIVIVYTTVSYSQTGSSFSVKYILVGLCLLFVVLANFMNALKPSFFVGFRTPWTLSNEENWRRTHKIGARLMFVLGLLMGVLILLLPERFSDFIFLPGTVLMFGFPFVYSFWLYKKGNLSQ